MKNLIFIFGIILFCGNGQIFATTSDFATVTIWSPVFGKTRIFVSSKEKNEKIMLDKNYDLNSLVGHTQIYNKAGEILSKLTEQGYVVISVNYVPDKLGIANIVYTLKKDHS